MKTIGIKLADGTFYPILEEGTPKKRMLDLTTAKDNQSKVQIDLYRSESGAMDDAEYVDTLEVTNLNPHPNGEPELHLSMGIDENGELTAEVVDPETGKKSETQVNLITRTKAEREAPNNFSLSNDDISVPNAENSEVPAMEEPLESPVEDVPSEESISTEPTEDYTLDDIEDADFAAEQAKAYEQPVEEVPESSDEDLSFADMFDTPIQTPESADSADNSEDLPDVPQSELEDAPFSFDNAETFATDDVVSEEPSAGSVEEPTIAESSSELDIANPDFNNLDEAPASEDIPVDELAMPSFDTLDSEVATDSVKTEDFEIPDFGNIEEKSEPAGGDTVSDTSLDMPSFDTIDSSEGSNLGIADAPSSADLDLPDFDNLESTGGTSDSLDLPSFDSTTVGADSTSAADSGSNFSVDSLDLPDFDNLDENKKESSRDTSFDIPDFGDTSSDAAASAAIASSAFDSSDFDLPDFDSKTSSSDDFSNMLDDDNSSSNTVSDTNFAAASPMDFSDLYDKETLHGEHATPYDDDEPAKKTRVPVIICIVCAIICIIATVLILFIIPSRYNLIPSRNTKKNAPSPIEKILPKHEKEKPAKEEAKKDEIKKDESKKEEKKADIKSEKLDKTDKTEKIDKGDNGVNAPKKEEKKEVISVLPPEPAKKEPKLAPQLEKKPEPIKAPEAQEDKVIISPTPDVVPVPKPEPIVKAEDVKYRIKWGDTLWDISGTFYKNPWKYPKIANYNHIKNPDLILSGTEILIPAE